MADVNTPRVWIGCLECYNNGRLVGRWYDASEAGDITTSQLHGRTVAPETHEELRCMDLDGDWPIRREMDPITAARWGEIYEEVGDTQWPALCAWVRSGSYTAEGHSDFPVVSDFEEHYAGEWDSFDEYARDLAESTDLLKGVPDEIQRYFDWESWIRDLEYDYSVERAPDGGGVFIFRVS